MDYIRQLEGFFLEAMRSGGYAVGSKYEDVPSAEGRGKRWTHQVSDNTTELMLIDQYYVHPRSKRSIGTTEIFDYGQLVWRMTYNGIYEQRAIPFLKKALLAAYAGGDNGQGIFVGGRGPISFSDDQLTYANNVTVLGDSFEMFQGWEEVRTHDGLLLGRHNYSGYLLGE